MTLNFCTKLVVLPISALLLFCASISTKTATQSKDAVKSGKAALKGPCTAPITIYNNNNDVKVEVAGPGVFDISWPILPGNGPSGTHCGTYEPGSPIAVDLGPANLYSPYPTGIISLKLNGVLVDTVHFSATGYYLLSPPVYVNDYSDELTIEVD